MLIKYSLQQQIHFNGNVFGNKCCPCNEGSLYLAIHRTPIKDIRYADLSLLGAHIWKYIFWHCVSCVPVIICITCKISSKGSIQLPYSAAGLGGSVGCESNWWSGGCRFVSHWVSNNLWIIKWFLQSFSPFCWFKKNSCQFLAKECAQYWLTT